MKIIIFFVFLFILSTDVFAQVDLDVVNQRICTRFEEDVSRLAAIMEEVRARKGITETRVAFGGIDDAIKSADYQITYAAEAIAYHRAQKFSSKDKLQYSLEILKSKILRAKTEVAKAI